MRVKTIDPRIIQAVQDAQSILILTHFQPDGDATGSAMALWHLFSGMEKRVEAACQDRIFQVHRFIPGSDTFLLPEEVDGEFDVVIATDAADEGRLGKAAALLKKGKVTIQIDHHATGSEFADYVYIDSQAPSSGTLVMRLIKELQRPITKEMAIALYTAISSDTGNFTFQGVNAETFEQMAELMRAGLPLADCARRLHLTETLGHQRLLGAALSTITLFEGGRICQMHLTLDDYKRLGATKEDEGNIVYQGLYMDDVRLCYLAMEDDDGIRFSLRAIAPYRVDVVAANFKGGGHVLASGCKMWGEKLPDALTKMRKAMIVALDTQ
jgi:phosphoesterase RecJ-like protein